MAVTRAPRLAPAPDAPSATGAETVAATPSRRGLLSSGVAVALAALISAVMPGVAGAGDPAALCEASAARAARATGVPLDVLRAIALTESGRNRGGRMQPWPWTLNAEGSGAWFESRAAAEAAAHRLADRGVRSIDLGCFQVNHNWHGEAFDSLEAMLDPDANALYAARFLGQLATELGSWEAAAGAYHSRTPALAERYVRRFRAHLANLSERPLPPPDAATGGATGGEAPRRLADYPLLQAGAATGTGSLVPAGGRPAALIAARVGALR